MPVKPKKRTPKKRDTRQDRVIAEVLAGLSGNPQVAAVITAIAPYIPVLKREGVELFNEVISFASKGAWTDADELVWEKMTDDERNALFSSVLSQARDAVDEAFERKTLLKEVAMKVAFSIIATLV